MGYTCSSNIFGTLVRLCATVWSIHVQFIGFTLGSDDKYMWVCSHYFVLKLQLIGCKGCVFEGSAPSSGGGRGSDSFFFPGFSFLSISGAGTRKRLKVKIFKNSERADCLFKQVRNKTQVNNTRFLMWGSLNGSSVCCWDFYKR